ncbi:MAG: chemotaxis protein CheA [Leptospiraceae bacterium]|nr:chemotaxis protein CheA [Leptospiraceae bacterium]MCP5492996.1 chemotaxis protein CheA [Leptospiraceae bacterium]
MNNVEVVIYYKSDCEFPSIISIEIFRFLSAREKNNHDFQSVIVDPDLFSSQISDEVDEEIEVSKYAFYFSSSYDMEVIRGIIATKLDAFHEIESYTIEEKKEDPIVFIDDIEDEKTPQRSEDSKVEQDEEEEEEEDGYQEEKIEQKTTFKESHRKKVENIRIDLSRLEELGNLVGELIINKLQISSYTEKLLKSNGKNSAELLEALNNSVIHLNEISNNLKDLSLGLRMVKISTLYKKIPAIVRDLSKNLKKLIKLKFEGDETELDKSIVDELYDPLLHLVRNSLDHGIETPEERKAIGKPNEGTIKISAFHEGNHAIIEVEDDGKGIDMEKIRQKLLDKKILTQESLDEMPDTEILNYIFLPGVTTKEKVTEVSGRGVGLDVVRSNIELLNGHLDIHSEKNIGTKFTMRLPLTLSILQVLLISDSDSVYAIPLYSIVDTNQWSNEVVKKTGSGFLYDKGNKILSTCLLSYLLNAKKEEESNPQYLLEVFSNGHSIGIGVDNILGQSEVVMKSLGNYIGKPEGISGATILSDGNVILILDPRGLVKRIKGE